MRIDKINYICNDCKAQAIFKSYKKARADGWAVGEDYVDCYCPECAPAHRLGGANGKTTALRRWLPEGYEQLSFEIK